VFRLPTPRDLGSAILPDARPVFLAKDGQSPHIHATMAPGAAQRFLKGLETHE
jgi:hypothetical protein